jgi:hypothetical protein
MKEICKEAALSSRIQVRHEGDMHMQGASTQLKDSGQTCRRFPRSQYSAQGFRSDMQEICKNSVLSSRIQVRHAGDMQEVSTQLKDSGQT